MPQIGFVILTHNRPRQTLRLVHTLGAQFDRPPIVIHHDFGKSPLNTNEFPDYVCFVRPHVDTNWGSSGINDAFILGLEELFRGDKPPDWFALLSGADYPIRPAGKILHDLDTGGFDLYLQHRVIDRVATDHFGYNMAKRYFYKIIHIHWLNHRLQWRLKTFGLPWFISRHLLPWSDSFRCYSGLIWCTGNRHAAELIISLHPKNPLKKQYKDVPLSDEFYLQSLLCNRSDIRVSPDNKRYIDFGEGLAHPKSLKVEDLPTMIVSQAHFARKFEPDDPVLDKLDEFIGIPPAVSTLTKAD
jgi:hypothetical protein